MKASSLRSIRAAWSVIALVGGSCGICPTALSAGDVGRLMVQVAPDTIHFSPSPEHAKHSWLIGAEYLWPNRWLAGYAYFNNSYGQKSHYIYGGRTWHVSGNASRYWYLKLTGGAILGYRDPYEDRIPFNNEGIGPGLIPGVGYQFDRFNVQLNLLGTAGLMFTFGYDLIP